MHHSQYPTYKGKGDQNEWTAWNGKYEKEPNGISGTAKWMSEIKTSWVDLTAYWIMQNEESVEFKKSQ